MRQLHNVTDVNLASSTKQQSQGATGNVCPVLWNAVLTFNSEGAPSTNNASVPARLGGGQ
jgi:hypothetical protein